MGGCRTGGRVWDSEPHAGYGGVDGGGYGGLAPPPHWMEHPIQEESAK